MEITVLSKKDHFDCAEYVFETKEMVAGENFFTFAVYNDGTYEVETLNNEKKDVYNHFSIFDLLKKTSI